MEDEVKKLLEVIELYKGMKELFPNNSLEVTLHGVSENAAIKAGLIDCSFIYKSDEGKKITDLYQLEKGHTWTLRVFTIQENER